MEITEEWVRGLTGWKPFKEGQTIAGQGLVGGFKQAGPVLHGNFREGRLNLRTVVKIEGPSDLRVQCACADHRATGGICAHAVALLLTAAKGGPPSRPPVEPAKQVPKLEPGPPNAWQIRFSPRFKEEWPAGRATVRLFPSSDSPDAADHRLNDWLSAKGRGAAPRQALPLRLDGADFEAFLDAIAGHPGIAIEGRATPFQIVPEAAAPLRLGDSRLENGQVVLELSDTENRRTLIPWGLSPACLSDDRLQRLPAGPGSKEWLRHVEALASNARLKLPMGEFAGSADAWLQVLESPQPGWIGTLRLAQIEPEFGLKIDGDLESIEAVLKVQYPEQPWQPVPAPGAPLSGLPCITGDGRFLARNPGSEDKARQRLVGMGFQLLAPGSRYRLRGRDAILSFIADDLESLRRQWRIEEGERFTRQSRTVEVIRPEIRERSNDQQSVEFELSFQTGGGKRLPSHEIRRLLRGGKRRHKLAGGAELWISRSCEDLLEPLAEELGIGRLDEPFRLSGVKEILLRNYREKYCKTNNANSSSDELPGVSIKGLRAELRPYQQSGVDWLADRLGRLGGALLADEMGLGKTLQTIALIRYTTSMGPASSGPCLVVVPTALLGNWMAEFQRFAPDLKVSLFHGAGRDGMRERVDREDVVVTSYGTLVRDLAFHLQREYRLVVADEASLLRNPDADLSKAISKLRAGARLALTGTPVENRAQDLWSIFRFVAPGHLGDRASFKERYEVAAVTDGGIASASLERLRLKISPFVLRRTKDQVARDLPNKIEIDEWLDLPRDQAAIYADLARSGLAEIEQIRSRQGQGAGQMHLLTLLLRLRQICVDPGLLEIDEAKASSAVKIERLLELLAERFESGRKTIVFSQFAQNLRRIEERVRQGFGRVFCIDGTTAKRQELVDSFQAEPGPAVFLISLKAGGYGLNLTAADAVVHLDPWWNPAVEAQATDRAHRIGQTRPVTVYRFLTRGTVEERVRRMQERKRALIDAATGESEGLPRNWTTRELEELLR